MEAGLVQVFTLELTGKALDWAVAGSSDPRYFGKLFQECVMHGRTHGGVVMNYQPSESMDACGYLIAEHMLTVKPVVTHNGAVTVWSAGMTWPCDTMPICAGPTLQVAVCRAVVMKMQGAKVWIPKELLPS